MIFFLKIKFSITIVSIIFIISSLKVNIYYKKNSKILPLLYNKIWIIEYQLSSLIDSNSTNSEIGKLYSIIKDRNYLFVFNNKRLKSYCTKVVDNELIAYTFRANYR